ncbi:MAG TPA: AraC family transcriptional regulator [Chitinophaga sp.]
MPVEILADIFRKRLNAIAPAAALQEVVEGYYRYTCDETVQELWATLDGHPVLLFLLDPPYSIEFTGAHTATLDDAFFCCYGLLHTYIRPWENGMRLLVVKFSCNGLYRLLQQPLAAVATTPLVSIATIWGEAGIQLAKQLRDAEIPQEQTALLDTFLLSRLPACKEAAYLVQAAVAHIREHKGQLSVQDLCLQLKVNYKWLERNFRKQLGITPKTYISTIRFLHAYLNTGKREENHTRVALEHGYYDQNHFIKEFRKHTGKTPSLT